MKGTKHDLMLLIQESIKEMTPEQKAECRRSLRANLTVARLCSQNWFSVNCPGADVREIDAEFLASLPAQLFHRM